MRAKLKNLFSVDIPDPERFVPEIPHDFCVSVTAIVGPENEPVEESFEIQVCTPTWLERRCRKDGFVIGRHYLIVADYNFNLIRSVISKLVHNVMGESWNEIAEKVARIGFWEFEDYRPYRVTGAGGPPFRHK